MAPPPISKPSEPLLPTAPPASSSSSARPDHPKARLPRSFHTPTGEVHLSPECLQVLNRLAAHEPFQDPWPPSPPGLAGRAAVLVALFPSRDGARLNVLLSRRSATLRSYPGQVALPGGKADPADGGDLERTARREAHEEVGLPVDPERVLYLTTLEPILSRAGLLITPVVTFVTDYSLQPALNPSEVSSLFSFPLEAFLRTRYSPIQPPSLADRPASADSLPANTTAANAPEATAFYEKEDYLWFEGRPYRFHKFNLPRASGGEATEEGRAVEGLTAGILVNCARIAYNQEADFEGKVEGQMSIHELVAAAASTAPIPLSHSQRLAHPADRVKSKL